MRIALLSQQHRYKSWQWLRWLPHTSREQLAGKPDLIAFGSSPCRALITALSKSLDQRSHSADPTRQGASGSPFYLVIFDGQADIQDEPGFISLIRNGKALNAAAIVITERLQDVPADCDALIQIRGHHIRYAKTGSQGISIEGTPESISLVQIDNLVHRLMRLTPLTLGQTSRMPASVNLLQLYNSASTKDMDINTRGLNCPTKAFYHFPPAWAVKA